MTSSETTSDKTCSKCKETKPVTEFSKDRNRGDGLRSDCKACLRADAKAYRAANLEKVTAAGKRYREANKEKCAAGHKAYCAANPELVAAQQKAWRTANPERIAAYQAARRGANPGAQQVHGSNFRARKAGVQGKLTLQEWLEILEAHEGRCAYCGVDGKMTIEHMTPWRRGGTNTRDNVVPACGTCNTRKGSLTAVEFLEMLEMAA